jgi:hypothetical protein
MKAILRTYTHENNDETAHEDQLVFIPDNYDGNPYGPNVPFSVGSNQAIIPLESEDYYVINPQVSEMIDLIEEIMSAKLMFTNETEENKFDNGTWKSDAQRILKNVLESRNGMKILLHK